MWATNAVTALRDVFGLKLNNRVSGSMINFPKQPLPVILVVLEGSTEMRCNEWLKAGSAGTSCAKSSPVWFTDFLFLLINFFFPKLRIPL